MKITFDRISGHFRSIRNFFFAGGSVADGCVADGNIIFQETCVSREYN